MTKRGVTVFRKRHNKCEQVGYFDVYFAVMLTTVHTVLEFLLFVVCARGALIDVIDYDMNSST